MTAVLSDIMEWLDKAHKKGCTHLIVAVDTYDYDNYPIYVTPDKNINEEIELITTKDMQGIDEIYNMSMSIKEQTLEHRAYHP